MASSVILRVVALNLDNFRCIMLHRLSNNPKKIRVNLMVHPLHRKVSLLKRAPEGQNEIASRCRKTRSKIPVVTIQYVFNTSL